MRILIIAAVIFWLIVGFAFGQTSKKTDYKLRVRNNALVLQYQNKSHKLNLTGAIDAAKITDAEILFASRADKYTYLVIDVSGMSKEKPDDRQCGAGVEANLIWLKLDAKWQKTAVDSVKYESCWSPVTSDDGYKISGSVLKLSFEDFRDDIVTVLTYDNEQPAKGFAKKSAALNVK